MGAWSPVPIVQGPANDRSSSDMKVWDDNSLRDSTALRDADGSVGDVNPLSTVLDDPGVQWASISFTFFRSVVDDIRTLAVDFNSLSTDILFQSDKEFSLMGILWLMITLYLSLRALEGVNLTPTLVLLAHMPMVLGRVSN